MDENEVVLPIPAPAPVTAAVPVTAAPAPVKPVVAAMPTAAPIEAADTPSFAGVKKEKEERSGWGPFRSRKKSDIPSIEEEMAIPSVPIVASPVAPAPKPAAEPTTKPATTVAAATPSSAAPAPTTFEVPRNESKKDDGKKEEKSNRDGGILSPIANIRLPRKEIDLTSAETIIQNGEIVGGTNTTFDAAPVSSGTGPKQAPQVVNGVKTYSSWDDVNARSSSAADRIISRMR